MESPTSYYNVSSKLREAVLNYLTGLVLRAYSEEAKAKLFFEKADEYIK